jgi:6-phosphogluconolactonase (cycloisomerase 2 family)
MRRFVRVITGAGIALALSTLAAPAIAGAAGRVHDQWHGGANVVFVQTDNTTGNQVVAYDRSESGALSYAAAYDTGGLGGTLNGSVVDHLASQGSLTFDRQHGLLFAVNAGSNSVSVFSVRHDQLTLVQQIGSGGDFPVSVATNGRVVYVLNAFDGGSVTGFWIGHDQLTAIPGSTRNLGLTIPTDATQFTHTPGQVAFSPDGDQLIVTTKATTNSIDVFGVHDGGWLTSTPVVNAEPDTVPFAISFDQRGHLVIANAGTNSLSTFWLHRDGSLTSLDTVGTGQAATCWVAPAGRFLFASNAGAPSESGFQVAHHGQLTLVSTTTTDGGAVDASATPDGRFLYVQAGLNGNVDAFKVNWDGSLTGIGAVTVPGAAGGEGIVAL